MIAKTFYITSKIFLALFLYMLISAVFSPILCQNKKSIIISNMYYNGKINRTSLEQFANLLYKEDSKSVVLFFSDKIYTDSDNNLQVAESVFSSLKTPAKIITDKLNPAEEAASEHSFEVNDFSIADNNKFLIGINFENTSGTNISLIPVETINQIADDNDLNQFSEVFVFSTEALSKAQNSSALLSLLKNKYVFSFYPVEKNITAQIHPVTNIVEIGIPLSLNADVMNYFLIEEIVDTIKILRKNNKNDLSETIYSISLNELKKSNVTDDKQIIDPALAKSFTLDFNSSSSAKNLIADNRIYTALDNGLIYLNDFKGKEKFVTELVGSIKTNPALYRDLILASTFEGDLYSINSNNGEILQVVGIGEKITSDIALTEIAIQNSKQIGALLGTTDGNIFCYDAFTFEQLWKNNITKFPVLSTPLVINDKVVFLNSYSSLYCVNAKTGSLIWKYEFKGTQNFYQSDYPLSDGKNVFSISSDGNLYAIDLLLGKKNWSVGVKDIINQIYISSDKQKLFLMDNKGTMFIFSAKDGKEIAKINFKKTGLFSFVIAELNNAETIAGFSDGSVYSFSSNYVPQELLSADQIPITLIKALNQKEFVIKNYFGKLTSYKIK